MGLLRAASIAVSLAAATLALPGTDSEPEPKGPYRDMRIGLVFDVGGRGDKSFNDSAYDGGLRAVRELGVTMELIEPSGPEDREAALRLFAARKFDLVVGVGYIFSVDINEVARDFPGTRFACVDYSPPADGKTPDNLVGLGFREEEGSFLVGAVAALESRTHHVGFVGGMDIPLIQRFEAGFKHGVVAACPDCEVHVAYAGTTPDAFRDPARGKAIATSQISAGADVLYHASGNTGHGMFEAARDFKVKAIGVDADQHDEMPGTILTSMVKRVDVAVFDAVVSVGEGTFRPGMKSFGVAEQGVGYVSDGPHAAGIRDTTRQRVAEFEASIRRGDIRVPNTR